MISSGHWWGDSSWRRSQLMGVAFVAAVGRAVNDRVVAHQELGAAGAAGIAAVDGAATARERADHAIPGDVDRKRLGWVAVHIAHPLPGNP